MASRLLHGAGALGLALVAGLIAGPWGETWPSPGDVVPRAGVPGDPIRGAQLYRRHDCGRCHAAHRTRHGVNIPPPVESAGSRSSRHWLVDYLLDPEPLRYRSENVRPDLVMPALAGDQTDARDLASFLAGLRDTARIPPLPEAQRSRGDLNLVAEGAQLFRQYQCLGCHELGGRGARVGPALDRVGARRTLGYMSALLNDPERVIPGTAMEDKDLWNEEVEALAAYLLTLKEPEP